MLQLITGLPGNGKTLYALAYVKRWAETDNRPVFYSGIAELTLPWHEIEADKWYDCPAGSIVVIDESQRIFRPRSAGAAVPVHVERMETHRHQGLDIVLITQHPMLIDTAIRRLVGKHMHVIRKFGTQNATIHEWGSTKENCDKPVAKQDSIKHHWKYDTSLYGLYKSAEVHTVKRSIPMKIYLFCLIPFLLIAAGLYMYRFIQSKMHPGTEAPAQVEQVASLVPAPQPEARPSPTSAVTHYEDALEDAKQYVYERTPRYEGLAFTAPRYDELTRPVRVPVIAGCISTDKMCRCYTHQATRMGMTDAMCREMMVKRPYIDFDPGNQALGGYALVVDGDLPAAALGDSHE